MNRKIITVIPARSGSKSIPNKNIKEFLGQPLIYWSLKPLQESNIIDEIYVGTDSKKIEEVVYGYNFNKVIVHNRKSENAQDESSTEDYLLEFIDWYEKLKNIKHEENKDLLFLVQATFPFFKAEDFEKAYNQYQNSANMDSMLSVTKCPKRFYWIPYTSDPLNYDINARPRRQNWKEHNNVYLENGGFYLNSMYNIIKFGNRLCNIIGYYVMDEKYNIEIDEIEDWEKAETIKASDNLSSLMQEDIKNIFKKILDNKVKEIVYGNNNYLDVCSDNFDSLITKENIEFMLGKQKNYNDIKLFVCDVDGTLTDGEVDDLRFNTRDWKGFELLMKNGIEVMLLTSSENRQVLYNKVLRFNEKIYNYGRINLFENIKDKYKFLLSYIIDNYNMYDFPNIAYIGDDINDLECLKKVGFPACPLDAIKKVINVNNIFMSKYNGGKGCVREFIDFILEKRNV